MLESKLSILQQRTRAAEETAIETTEKLSAAITAYQTNHEKLHHTKAAYERWSTSREVLAMLSHHRHRARFVYGRSALGDAQRLLHVQGSRQVVGAGGDAQRAAEATPGGRAAESADACSHSGTGR